MCIGLHAVCTTYKVEQAWLETLCNVLQQLQWLYDMVNGAYFLGTEVTAFADTALELYGDSEYGIHRSDSSLVMVPEYM